jgi:cytochrome c oxidase cbb3-type subunit 2
MSWLSLHHRLERNAGLLIFGILVVSAIGGMVQLLPIVTEDPHAHGPPGPAPYSALELEGRDIYIRESCSTCHTQQIRPLLAEVKRYGPYSRAEEFVYDRPFLWGSKRTGPDLHRVGGTLQRCLAPPAPARSALGRAGVDHAGLTRGLQGTRQTATAAFRLACARW